MHSGHEANCPFSQTFACHVICAKRSISTMAFSGTQRIRLMSGDDAAAIDHLIETDPRILELVHKELNQEYLRLMSRALQMVRNTQAAATAPQAAASNPSEKSN